MPKWFFFFLPFNVLQLDEMKEEETTGQGEGQVEVPSA